MNLTDIRHRATKMKKSQRKGQGNATGSGNYSGRGNKGYHSRSGSGRRIFSEGGQMPLYRRLPKIGFTNGSFEKCDVGVNVSHLEKFEDGAKITPLELMASGIIKGRMDRVRVLGKGEITRKCEVHAHHFTASAKAKIEGAGGKCVVLSYGDRRPKFVKKEKNTKE